MDQHSIVLRDAKPTFDEGLACGRYLDEAAEGSMRPLLSINLSGIRKISSLRWPTGTLLHRAPQLLTHHLVRESRHIVS